VSCSPALEGRAPAIHNQQIAGNTTRRLRARDMPGLRSWFERLDVKTV
jgi:hypothetical protein